MAVRVVRWRFHIFRRLDGARPQVQQLLKILANPDPDDESRQEWIRTRQYRPFDDDLTYPEEQHALTVADPTAAQDRASSGTTRESGRTAKVPTASTAAHARRTAAGSGKANRSTISK